MDGLSNLCHSSYLWCPINLNKWYGQDPARQACHKAASPGSMTRGWSCCQVPASWETRQKSTNAPPSPLPSPTPAIVIIRAGTTTSRADTQQHPGQLGGAQNWKLLVGYVSLLICKSLCKSQTWSCALVLFHSYCLHSRDNCAFGGFCGGGLQMEKPLACWAVDAGQRV